MMITKKGHHVPKEQGLNFSKRLKNGPMLLKVKYIGWVAWQEQEKAPLLNPCARHLKKSKFLLVHSSVQGRFLLVGSIQGSFQPLLVSLHNIPVHFLRLLQRSYRKIPTLPVGKLQNKWSC